MRIARRWPTATFFTLAFAFTWALLPAAQAHVGIALLSLFGPAVAGVITAALIGRPALGELGRRIVRWRVGSRWYLAALLLPIPISALSTGIEYLAGAHGNIVFQPITALGLVVFVLVIGEEIGWRGFAWPRLSEQLGSWRGALVLGALWALWHLPLFYLSGMPQHGSPFPPYIGYTIALAILLGVLMDRTAGSVVIATLFHGAVNLLGFTNTASTAMLRGWAIAASYLVVALVVGAIAWRRRVDPIAPAGRQASLG